MRPTILKARQNGAEQVASPKSPGPRPSSDNSRIALEAGPRNGKERRNRHLASSDPVLWVSRIVEENSATLPIITVLADVLADLYDH